MPTVNEKLAPATAPTQVASPDVNALLAAGAAHANPKETDGYEPYALVPDGYKKEKLDHQIDPPLPDHIKQDITLYDPESFIGYVNRYKTGDTLLFGEILDSAAGARFLSVFDYHHAKGAEGDTQANRTDHKANFPAPFSEEWRRWVNHSGQGMNQEAFARFLDENIPDVIKPDGATLLEVILNFEMKTNVRFKSDIRPSDGNRVLKFTEEVDGTGGSTAEKSMKVPEEFVINIPVFYMGKRFDVKAKLFYRAPEGKLVVMYQLYRPHEIVEAAIRDIIKDIEAGTGIKPLLGSPQ